jgi:hypothetical protein
MEDRANSTGPADEEKPVWSRPTVEILELCEIESAADLDVAFTTTHTCGDL